MIIHRAFIKEILQTCAAVFTVLLSIFMVTRLIGFLRQAAEGDIALDYVLTLLFLKMITYLDVLMPLALYISTLLVMARWIRNNELLVINACGISISQFLRPIFSLFILVGCFVGAFSLYLAPLSAAGVWTIEKEFRDRNDISGVVTGVFTETQSGNGVYFVERYDKQADIYRDIFIYTAGDSKEARVVVADHGFRSVDETTAAEFLILKDGSEYRGQAGDIEYSVTDFETYALVLEPPPKKTYRLPIKARPTLELLKSENKLFIGELHWRLSKVVILLVLMIFALAFSSITHRKHRFPGLLVALTVYFLYSNMLGFGLALIRRGSIAPHLSLWLIHLAFFALAAYLFNRRSQNKPLIPLLSA